VSKLLVVDDEPSICWGIQQLGESLGHEVFTASTAEAGLELAAAHRPDVVVMDVRLPGMDGLSAIDQLRLRLGSVPIIVITAYGDLQTAVTAVQKGAFEYLVKPFDLEQVEQVLGRALARETADEVEAQDADHVAGLVGRSAAMQEAFKRIALAAASEANVLLSGESGTGKELAARAIHRFSSRGQGPFVAVNVASLSPSLAESELFGHVRGAFTGAEQDRAGLLAQADGGTLFLDEVADIPLTTQVKLLRAIEHGEVIPVGSNVPVSTNFRLVSATHQNLLRVVDENQFRHDLYFRICTFRIDLPPLRERRDDIVPLAEHFLGLLMARASSHGVDAARPRLSAAIKEELARRDWYGNVRELRNAIEHAVVLSRGANLMPEHLPAPVDAPRGEGAVDDPERIAALVGDWAAAKLESEPTTAELHNELLKLVEPPLLEEALKHSHGQYVAAAKRLGLHRTTVKKKLNQYGLEGEDGDQ
jgi:two-component system nitrogen regulation response regulator GlnG